MVETTKENIKESEPKVCEYPDCQKKIRLTDFACKCANVYCKMHRLPEQHGCNYDYRGSESKSKRIEDMRCVSNKLQKIDS